jgi:PIN domain nuclease of toxin-antitoxin system
VSHLLIDTHVLAWSLVASSLLPLETRSLIESGATIHVPPCALHEITLKVRKGKWDAMAPHVGSLDRLCATQGFRIAPYTAGMAMLAGSIGWDHDDLFDRMIAATAIEMACPLLSKDAAFDGLSGFSNWKGRIWS